MCTPWGHASPYGAVSPCAPMALCTPHTHTSPCAPRHPPTHIYVCAWPPGTASCPPPPCPPPQKKKKSPCPHSPGRGHPAPPPPRGSLADPFWGKGFLSAGGSTASPDRKKIREGKGPAASAGQGGTQGHPWGGGVRVSGVAQTPFAPPQGLGDVLQSHPAPAPQGPAAAACGTGTPGPWVGNVPGWGGAGRVKGGGSGSILGTGGIGEQREILGVLLVSGAGDPWGRGMERWGRGTGWRGHGTGGQGHGTG